jgi:hypothetical protein
MNNQEEMTDVEITLDGNLLKSVQALAAQGYLGSTPEAVIEHCLRQYMFETARKQAGEVSE